MAVMTWMLVLRIKSWFTKRRKYSILMNVDEKFKFVHGWDENV